MDSLRSKRYWKQSKRCKDVWYLYEVDKKDIKAAMTTIKRRWIGRRVTKSIVRAITAILVLSGYLVAILGILKLF